MSPYCSRAKTLCGAVLAWARIAMPACCRICAFVNAAVSAAKSASRIRLREASRFSLTADKLAIVDSKRFWMAPSVLRKPLTVVSAASTRPIVVLASATVVTEAEFNAELPSANDVAV